MTSVRIKVALGTMAVLFLGALPAAAAFRTTVTKSDDFKQVELSRVAVVTAECYKTVDCSAIERKVYAEALKMKVRFKVVPESRVRDSLFSQGHTKYNIDLRQALADSLDLDGLIELRIPFAEKGDGYGGRKGSEVKVELLLIRPDGGILIHGVGTGRPANVVTSPERVAGNLVEKILKKAFE
ncbi:MAG: hypothetical protein K0U98_25855 [Deltaproteobacteria bacterium]|nr:hypothetical protein [Deltaproteobacteria bacterium]